MGLLMALRAKGPDADTGEVPIFTVEEGPLTISVAESGTIKPREQEIIKCELEGRTTILYLISEGTRVKEGELLVELDASQLQDSKIDQEIQVENAEAAFIQSRENREVVKNQAESDVAGAELDLQFATEDLEHYLKGEYPNALREQEARITLAEEEHRRAEEKLKWSKVLFDEKYLAESELQADELAVKKAKLDVELAQNNLKLLKDFTYKRSVTERESAIKQAVRALERVKRKASANMVQADAELRAKESGFKQQTDKLGKLIEQIEKARIVAPREGLVVYATSAQFSWRGNTEPLDEGQEVRERQELIHLPTASTFMAGIKIHESSLDKIAVGHPVRITVDALPGKEFTGKVAVIAPLPDPMSMFMNPDLKQFSTEIHIDGGGDILRTGMSCRSEIIVERYAKTVYVPVQCVMRVRGQTTVFVKTRTGNEARSVSIGLDNNRMVRILDGLTVGEEVLLAPPLDTAGVSEEDAAAEVVKPEDISPMSGKAPAGQPARQGPGDGERGQGMSVDAKEKMRERMKNMSTEEREAMKKRTQERSGRSPGGEPREDR